MTPEIQAKIEGLGTAFEQFKAAHKAELEELKSKGHVTSHTTEQVEKLNERVSKAEEALESAKAAMNRSRQANNEEDAGKEAKEYQKELNSYMRKGLEPRAGLAQEIYKKSMDIIVDEDGGFLVTPEQSSEIVKKVFESTPLRQLASVQTIGSDSFEILEDLDEFAAGWVGEVEARGNTAEAKLKMVKIPVHEIYAKPKATQKFLDDANINIEAWLNEKLAGKFGRIEATAFISGDGVKRPKGILSYVSGTGFDQVERITTASANVIAADDLIELVYSLKEPYLMNASFLVNRNTVKVIRKMKGSDGQYLWSPGLNGQGQGSVLGHQLYQAADLFAFDSVTAANNANTEQIIFGDIKAGYQIVDRIGIRILRDPFSSKPFVEFYSTKRVGGGVKNFEAMKVLKVHA